MDWKLEVVVVPVTGGAWNQEQGSSRRGKAGGARRRWFP